MKYIFFVHEFNGFPIAKRLVDEGNEVIVGHVKYLDSIKLRQEKGENANEDRENKKLRLSSYNNILEKVYAEDLVEKLEKIKNPEDYFIFFDDNYYFEFAKKLKHRGFKGNFPTKEDRRFEIDRGFAKNFVRKYYPNVKVPLIKGFTSIDAARLFLKSTKEIWVIKSQGDDVPTFVPDTSNSSIAAKQIEEYLHIYNKYYEKQGFLLEKKINFPIEVTPEKIYYDGIPLAVTVNFENKYFGSGNIGFQVGCAGDLIFPVPMDSKIAQICFPPIVDEMAKRHKGLFIWDASLLIDKETDDIYFGEFCSNRPGYNSIFTEIELADSASNFFEKIMMHKNPFKNRIGSSVSLFNFALDALEDIYQKNTAIYMEEKVNKHFWPYGVYADKKSQLKTTGYYFFLGPITASGKTVTESVNTLYEYVDGISLANLYYRPKFDFISLEYSTSIISRLNYCTEKKLFEK